MCNSSFCLWTELGSCKIHSLFLRVLDRVYLFFSREVFSHVMYNGLSERDYSLSN